MCKATPLRARDPVRKCAHACALAGKEFRNAKDFSILHHGDTVARVGRSDAFPGTIQMALGFAIGMARHASTLLAPFGRPRELS